MAPPQRFGRVLFRVAGIEVAVHSSWLIIFAILVLIARAEIAPRIVAEESGWIAPLSIAIALLFYTFVLLHELSHALMARAHGLDAKRITLFVFGGVAQIGAEAERPADEFRIAIAGPLASLVIAGVLAAVSLTLHPEFDLQTDTSPYLLPGVWGLLAVVNLALALFNLVPAFPLDGGRVLRAALWRGLRDRAKATRWSAVLGKAFAFSMIGAGGAIAFVELGWGDSSDALQGLWYVVLGMFLFNVAGSAEKVEGGAEPRKGPPTQDEALVSSRDYLDKG
ncbi:MAG TPA: site-2 protease family protein [Actinomycetota bacterium]|nr:site-2 protease family protein [Actinomycetota bacterium]